MKKNCPNCQRKVGVKKAEGNPAQMTLARHRTAKGSKNKNKETRSPYCKGTGREVS